MIIKVKEIAYHRNGICGEGFHVVTFTQAEYGQTHNMLGILFEGSGRCAVLDVDQTAAGNIAFANGNSWRGDHFEDDLRKAITEDQARWEASIEKGVKRP